MGWTADQIAEGYQRMTGQTTIGVTAYGQASKQSN